MDNIEEKLDSIGSRIQEIERELSESAELLKDLKDAENDELVAKEESYRQGLLMELSRLQGHEYKEEDEFVIPPKDYSSYVPEEPVTEAPVVEEEPETEVSTEEPSEEEVVENTEVESEGSLDVTSMSDEEISSNLRDLWLKINTSGEGVNPEDQALFDALTHEQARRKKAAVDAEITEEEPITEETVEEPSTEVPIEEPSEEEVVKTESETETPEGETIEEERVVTPPIAEEGSEAEVEDAEEERVDTETSTETETAETVAPVTEETKTEKERIKEHFVDVINDSCKAYFDIVGTDREAAIRFLMKKIIAEQDLKLIIDNWETVEEGNLHFNTEIPEEILDPESKYSKATELDKLKKEKEELEAEHRRLLEENERLKAENEALRVENESLKAENEELLETKEKMEKALVDSSKVNAKLSEMITGAEPIVEEAPAVEETESIEGPVLAA